MQLKNLSLFSQKLCALGACFLTSVCVERICQYSTLAHKTSFYSL